MKRASLRSHLGASFAALALALPTTAPAEPPPPPNAALSARALDDAAAVNEPLTVISNIFNAGSRGIVVGDMHEDLALPLWLADNMKNLKQQGVNTLYVEVPSNYQPVLDRIGKGDESAKVELNRMAYETTPGGLQARTMLIDAAFKAGMRVIAMDVPIAEQMALLKKDRDQYSRRLLWSDPAMAATIRQHDDGSRYLVFVGLAHTYPANLNIAPTSPKPVDANAQPGSPRPDIEMSCVDWQKFLLIPYTQEGGIDRRLGAVSIDGANCPIHDNQQPPTIRRSQGRGADFILTTPSHPLQDIGFPGSDYRGWRQLLARDAQNLFMPSFSGPPYAVPSAEIALNLLELRDLMKPGADLKKISAKSHELSKRIARLDGSESIRPEQLQSMKRHLSQMEKASLHILTYGPFPDRLPTVQDNAVPLNSTRLEAGEEQLQLMRQRIGVQLQSMYARGMGKPPEATIAQTGRLSAPKAE